MQAGRTLRSDTTDVYAFRSADNPSTVTLIANWIPLQQPAAGPNFYKFSDNVTYKINIDNDGDALPDIVYSFDFTTTVRNANTFLYNTGPVTSLTDPDLNVYQVYTVTRTLMADGGQPASAPSAPTAPTAPAVPLDHLAIVAPANIGPRSMPNYDALAQQAIYPIPPARGGGLVFAGPRDDPFYVDLGSAFDLLGLRPLNPFHLIPLPAEAGVDGVAGYNVHTTAIQVPIASMMSPNGVIGVWATSVRANVQAATQVLPQGGQDKGQAVGSGPAGPGGTQVSRLGMPLVNEVVIPLAQKDIWNASQPVNDGQFAARVITPEMTSLINLLYPPVINAPEGQRSDLVAVFVTGIAGLNQLQTVTPSEMIRLNMTIPPIDPGGRAPDRLGVTGGDFAGFPNGRRLIDDVVDIELRALVCAYGKAGPIIFQQTGQCDPAIYNQFPNNAITDGLDANEKPFLPSFPYMASPYSGYEAEPPTDALAAGVALAGIGLIAFAAYRRRVVSG